MIRLRDVTVVRGPNRLVENLRLRVEPGRIFWIVGPNGSGKTSLLRVIAGLDLPRCGSVERGTRPLLYFHSEMALPPSSTVRSWERLVRRVERSGEGARRTPLWPDVPVERKIGHLSTGQRKRLLLDALLRQPGPVLLDEPFEHLSPGARSELGRLLDDRARRYEVIVATNQDPIRAGAGAGLRLEGGAAFELTTLGGVR